LLPCLSQTQISSFALYSQTPWTYVLPSMWQNKFCTHTKQQAELFFFMSESLYISIAELKAEDSALKKSMHFFFSFCS
jgi:hypothetical protein